MAVKWLNFIEPVYLLCKRGIIALAYRIIVGGLNKLVCLKYLAQSWQLKNIPCFLLLLPLLLLLRRKFFCINQRSKTKRTQIDGLVNCCCLVTKLSPTLLRPHWTVAHQALLSKEFPRQEYWNGLSFPSPWDLPDPGIKPMSPAFASGFFTTEPPGKPQIDG